MTFRAGNPRISVVGRPLSTLLIMTALLTGCSKPAIQIGSPSPDAPVSNEQAVLPASTSDAGSETTPERQVVMISIDGLRPEFYQSNAYDTPTLKWLRDNGASAQGVLSVYPTVTYPNHTTMVTGVHAAKHGVVANTIFSFTDGPLKDWYWNSELIRVPTLWQAAADDGLTTAALGWPVTVGARINWNIPEIFNPSDTGPSSWELTRRNSSRELLDQVAHASPVKEFHEYADHDVYMTAGAISILKKQKPNLLLLHLVNADHVQHETGRASKATREAIAGIDRQLKQIVEAIDLKRATLVVLGDHGFLDFDKSLNFNALFAKKGWLEVSNGKITDWRVVAHGSGGQAAIYVRDESLKLQVAKLLKAENKGRYTVLSRERLDGLGAYPEAFCAVDPVDGYSVGSKLEGPFELKNKKVAGNHGYRPSRPQLHTGLLVAGPNIPKRKNLGLVKLIDVAPTVARVLKVELPSAQGQAIDFGARPQAPAKGRMRGDLQLRR